VLKDSSTISKRSRQAPFEKGGKKGLRRVPFGSGTENTDLGGSAPEGIKGDSRLSFSSSGKEHWRRIVDPLKKSERQILIGLVGTKEVNLPSALRRSIR